MADYSEFVERVSSAAKEFNQLAAAAACQELIRRIQTSPDPAPVQPIKAILSALRNKRYVDLMERVADAIIQSGQNDPQVRRQYAQALIDQGRITAALDVLHALEKDTSDTGTMKNRSENAEANGLIGRAHKQAYVDAVNGSLQMGEAARANRRHLEHAVRAYFGVYDSDRDRYLWHGINTVACLCRAERDGIPIDGYPDPRAIATAILETIDAVTPREKVAIWDRATAVEACVALNRLSTAKEWLAVYATDPAADAFELGSTLRQMKEVWRLAPGAEPGSTVLPILDSALLQRHGGRIDLGGSLQSTRAPIHDEVLALEAVLGDTRFVPLTWYRTGLERCGAVGRIETKWGQGFGTGFLVRGEDLHRALAGEILLVTNAHVISNDPLVQRGNPPALPPQRARVRFEGRDDGSDKTYAITEVVWTSPPGKLDVSVLRLESCLTCDPPYPVAVALPAPKKDRVYVIGHPKGGTLSISIQDNHVVDVKAPKLRYRAPTEPGSSGSPVFNQDWELVALHHAGSKTMVSLSGEGVEEANEGIWIAAIIEALDKELGHGTP